MRTAFCLCLLALLALPAAFAQDRPELAPSVRQYLALDEPVVALVGVRVIDGTGGAVRENQTVVIEGSQIAAVGPRGSVRVPEGADVHELDGHTVLPGLIGLHNHTFYTTSKRSIQLNYSAPRLYLAAGVTTVRTTGSHSPYSEINLAQAIDDGTVPGPKIYNTGPYMTGGTGVSQMTRLSGPEDARRLVAYWAEEGVTWFKAYTQISRAELGAAIDEAHQRGLKVTAHLCSVSFQEAVALGIDNLEHGLFANTDFVAGKKPDECPPGFLRQYDDLDMDSDAVQQTFRVMIENGVSMTSTLAVYEMYVPGRPPLEQRNLDMMSPETREEYLATRQQIADLGEDAYYSEHRFRVGQAFEYAFAQAGGLLAAGVDPTGYGGALPGFGDQRNYELLLEAGFTPVEVIQIMSLNGAKVLGIDERLGSVEAGKQADLVVIRGDLAADPATIRNVAMVFKEGYGYDPARLLRDVAGLVGLR